MKMPRYQRRFDFVPPVLGQVGNSLIFGECRPPKMMPKVCLGMPFAIVVGQPRTHGDWAGECVFENTDPVFQSEPTILHECSRRRRAAATLAICDA